jgi:hypothetical protein
MVLKTTLNGDKIPICRVEDLEITLVSPDLPIRVRLPTKNEQQWRSLSEIRAAEIQCMQLSLALLARHESEMYVTIEGEKNTSNYLQSSYYQDQRPMKSHQSSEAVKKHLEECEKVFSTNTKSKSKIDDHSHLHNTSDRLPKSSSASGTILPRQSSREHHEPSRSSRNHPSHAASDKFYRTSSKDESGDAYNRSRRPLIKQNSLAASSGTHKTKTNIN